MSEHFVQHSFKHGVLKLSWYNAWQERKLTPGEALELSNQLRDWVLDLDSDSGDFFEELQKYSDGLKEVE